MTRTERLTGHKPERYKEATEALSSLRIDDMKELLNVLRIEARQLEIGSNKWSKISDRYQEVVVAIKWWNELKNEGNENDLY